MEFYPILAVDIGTVSEQSFNFGYISILGLIDCEFQSAIKSKFVWFLDLNFTESNREISVKYVPKTVLCEGVCSTLEHTFQQSTPNSVVNKSFRKVCSRVEHTHQF